MLIIFQTTSIFTNTAMVFDQNINKKEKFIHNPCQYEYSNHSISSTSSENMLFIINYVLILGIYIFQIVFLRPLRKEDKLI